MDLELQDNSRFNKFFSMMGIFKKTKPALNPIELKLQEEKKEVHSKINFLIDSDNAEQLKLLDSKNVIIPFDLFFKVMSEKPKLLNSLNVDQYVKEYDKEIKEEIKKTIVYFSSIMDIDYTGNVTIKNKRFDYYINCCEFTNNLKFDDKKETDFFYYSLLDIIKKIPKVTYRKSDQFYNATYSFFDKIKKSFDHFSISEINNLAEKTKILRADLSNLSPKIAEVVLSKTTFSDSDLNKTSLTILNEIKILFLELQKNKLDINDSLVVENLYIKRLPQVIGEYVSIPAKYREKLKSHTDNPDSLLIDSLSEIKSNLSDIMTKIQEDNLKKMKISNTYLKSI